MEHKIISIRLTIATDIFSPIPFHDDFQTLPDFTIYWLWFAFDFRYQNRKQNYKE